MGRELSRHAFQVRAVRNTMVRMGEYIARAVDETLAEFDLNRGEAEVLFALVRNPHIDITPKIIQTRILVSSGGLTRRLDALRRRD